MGFFLYRFFFEMLLFLIVKRKVQPTIIIRYWAKKEYKKHWWEMCFVSLCARVLSSSTEAEAFRQKKERKLGKREKTKITLCVSTVCVCVCVKRFFRLCCRA